MGIVRCASIDEIASQSEFFCTLGIDRILPRDRLISSCAIHPRTSTSSDRGVSCCVQAFRFIIHFMAHGRWLNSCMAGLFNVCLYVFLAYDTAGSSSCGETRFACLLNPIVHAACPLVHFRDSVDTLLSNRGSEDSRKCCTFRLYLDETLAGVVAIVKPEK
ncbi:hypothetical protein BDZ89DRAFT_331019 [Hymenopellis radicata]|nr:hypothetical protein BDZ89DRAFT_331019 [Hymenopellis radicata]